MSTVRMCDRCGLVFAEGIEGSAVGTVTLMVKNERSGRTEAVQKTQDHCPDCAAGKSVAPRLAAIEGGATARRSISVDDETGEVTHRDGRRTMIDGPHD